MIIKCGWHFYQPFYTDIFYHCKSFWKKLAFLPTIWKFTQSARDYTIAIILICDGLLPLLPVAESQGKTTQTKHVKEIVDTVRGVGALGLLYFSFFSENIGEKERLCYYIGFFVSMFRCLFLNILICLYV